MLSRLREFDFFKAVNDELEDINRELELIKILLKKHRRKPLDDIEIRAAALSLSTIYNGIETVMTFALKDRGKILPAGGRYHSQILELAERQGIIDKEIRAVLKNFMGFRHFIRHAYSFEIDASEILEILESCPGLVRSFECQIRKIYS